MTNKDFAGFSRRFHTRRHAYGYTLQISNIRHFIMDNSYFTQLDANTQFKTGRP